MKKFSVVFMTLLCSALADFSDDYDTKPNIRVNYLSQNSDQIETFLGNQTHRDHFKLLRSDGVSLLIGARNVVYNLSLADLKENVDQRITWPSRASEREMCLIKGKSEDECQNYIRVLAQTDTKHLLVCGTNSYKPKCRTYTSLAETVNNDKAKMVRIAKAAAAAANQGLQMVQEEDVEEEADEGQEEGPFFRMKHEFSGLGICPHDPRHNSTAIFADGELYSGTTADFSGSDALIYRDSIRTEQNDLRHLNAPDFVSSIEDKDHVYFFFRESAVEHINCGKTIYSRVARVCKNDQGGPQRTKHLWTTFLKSRLNCSIPGEFPFYFDEIQGTSSSAIGKDQLIYGVFTTPENSISGSAICAFRLADILASFNGDFKGRSSAESNWLPIKNFELPKDSPNRPGSCSADSKNLPESTLNFIKSHSLMDQPVGNVYNAPLFVKTAVNERLTVIAVDPQVRTPADGMTYDVMYVGTTRGKILKIVSVEDDQKFDLSRDQPVLARKPVVIEEMQVFPYHVSVANVQVVQPKDSSKKKLVVLSGHEVKALPLHRCNAARVQSCKACVGLQDPHCAWNVQKRKCVDSTQFNDADASSLLQDVFHGNHAACDNEDQDNLKLYQKIVEPLNEVSNELTTTDQEGADEQEDEIDIVINFEPDEEGEEYPYYEGRALNPDEIIYTEAAMTTATTVTAFIALLVGLVSGALLQRKCSKDGYRNCGHHYLEQQAHMNKQHESSALHHTESGYTSAPCNNLTASTSSSNTTATTSSLGGDPTLHKNSNLLVNLTTKSDPEKNNIGSNSNNSCSSSGNSNNGGGGGVINGGPNTSSIVTPSETSIIYNGTIPRNGTLCKKVYL